jgi:hypothetical protein
MDIGRDAAGPEIELARQELERRLEQLEARARALAKWQLYK